MSVGVVFAVYDTGVLFPITNATEQVQRTNASITTVVGSPVLGVTVGPGLNFSNLTEPVRILLRLNELEVGDRNMCVINICEKCLYVHFSICDTSQYMSLTYYKLHFTLVSIVTGIIFHKITGSCRFCFMSHCKICSSKLPCVFSIHVRIMCRTPGT